MINWLIEAVYDFYKDPRNLAEFEKWRKERIHNNENDMAVKSSSLSDGNRNNRIYRN